MQQPETILLQTRDSKLQQRILVDDLDYTDIIRQGLALEQGRRRVDEINYSRDKPEETQVAEFEEIRRLDNQRETGWTGESSTTGRGLAPSCNTCTRPNHGRSLCPGRKAQCYRCRHMGHFRGSRACRAQQAEGKTRTQMERVNQVDDLGDKDKDSVGRVTEGVDRTMSNTMKGRMAKVLLTALHRKEKGPVKANLLVDSGVHKTLLTEEQWERIRPGKTSNKPQLEESNIRLTPYGTGKSLEVLGTTECLIRVEAGTENMATVYIIRGARESLLEQRDAQAL